MLVIDHTILPEALFSQCFCCDLQRCRGACCIEGDAGAPLEEEEVGELEDLLPDILPFMTAAGREVVEKGGVFDYDMDGCLVTPLVNDRECVFMYEEEGCALCAIEKAFLERRIPFRKPISCHLYPIRIERKNWYDVLQYHRWDICDPARACGAGKGIPLIEYLKEPLVRKYGEEWYRKVQDALASRKEASSVLKK